MVMPRTRKKSYRQKQNARRKKLQLETPEHKALRLEKNRTRAAIRRAGENELQREIRLAKDRARQNTVRASRRSTEKSVYNRLKFLENDSTFNELTIKQSLVYERLKAQREAAAVRQAERRRQETPEQRAIRLEKDRIRVAMSRANETEEARAIRLARQRHQVNAARLRLKYKAQLLPGQVDTINSLQNKPIFDPIHKMFENQFNNLNNDNFIEQSRAIAEFHGIYHQLKTYTSLSNYPQIISESCENEEATFEDYPESDASPVAVEGVECEIIIQEGSESEEINTDETMDSVEESNYKTAFGTSLPISKKRSA
ncbi:SAFB-like transcription modulator isoform X3 [Homalodisca vitripennis]|uniref:SAFB-like transcription modulator isoform X3 n=1 Tax=Homalodisca vitripennis TaxID=197043 RepID=UPI001EECDBFC|nr:SAFB-like transcription modulator isoform X3 [Homalodisca vitripennis]